MHVELISVTQPTNPDLTPEGLIAYCARVSSPNQENPNYVGLLKYCIREKHWCYDDQTEVLTEKGFVPFKGLTFNDKVAAYDFVSKSVRFENPIQLSKSDYDGDLIRFQTFLNDLLVTPNHRMLGVIRKQSTNGKFYRDFVDLAENLTDTTFAIRSTVPQNTRNRIAVPLIDSDRFLEFIGFFLGDGCCKGTDNYPTFHLKRQRKIFYLKDLCKSLGVEIYEREKTSNFVVKLSGFKEYALNFLYSDAGHKTIPDDFLLMSSEQFAFLLSGLMESDGCQSSRGKGTMQYTTTSDLLADKLQVLCVLNGFSCNNKQRNRNDGHYVRDVFINKKQFAWIDKHRTSRFGLPKMEPYKGMVYCCSVSTGMIVVRRNNKISICGNSIFEMVDMTVEITTTRAIAAQILRHKSFSVQEFSQRYAVAPGYMAYDARRQDDKNRQNSIDDLPVDVKESFLFFQEQVWEFAFARYQEAIANGVAKECARMMLPLNTVTRLYMKGSVRSWIHYLEVRCDPSTQKEHRDIAEAIKAIFCEQFPTIANALDW